jgi:hypothetical protein
MQLNRIAEHAEHEKLNSDVWRRTMQAAKDKPGNVPDHRAHWWVLSISILKALMLLNSIAELWVNTSNLHMMRKVTDASLESTTCIC